MGTLENQARKVEYVKMIKQGPGKKSELIFTGLTYIVAILLIVFAVVPTVKTVQSIDKEIRKKEQVSIALKDKLAALTSLDNQYNENKETFNNLTLIYPTSQNFSLLLANMDAIVTRKSFVLSSIGFSETTKAKDSSYDLMLKELKPYSVRLSVNGSRINLINFLKDLEALPMYPVIESITYANDVDDKGNTDYAIMMRVYLIEKVNFYD